VQKSNDALRKASVGYNFKSNDLRSRFEISFLIVILILNHFVVCDFKSVITGF